MRKAACLLALLFLTSLSATLLARTQSASSADSPHVIEVTAKTFEFVPSEIHAKVGERVQIKRRSADRAHGLMLNIYPEGASEDGNPGLVFDHPQDAQDYAKVEKKKERVIEFVAARAGTISNARCSAA